MNVKVNRISGRSNVTHCNILLVLVSIALTFACNGNGSARNEKESSKVERHPAFPNAIVIKKFKDITFDLSAQKEDVWLQVCCLAELADGKMYSVIMYDMQPIKGAWFGPKERYVPFGVGAPVVPSQGLVSIPDSAEVKRVVFLLRATKNNGDDPKWQFFEPPSQDWSNPVKVPVIESLPFCADSPYTRDYSSYYSEAYKLAEHLNK
jgi:hypothetical protein